MDVDALAQGIVDGVGGPANIRSIGHCTTRLRLVLVDKGQARKEAVRGLPGVASTVEGAGQLQVVIGHDVGEVERRVRDLVATARDGRESETAAPPRRWWDRLFDLITGTFHPLLYALVGSSMVKTFLTLAVQFGWISTSSPTYAIWAAAGNAAFYFLPVLVGITASKRLGANPYLGGVIAAALLDENFTGLGSAGTRTSFLGIPVSIVEYGQSVLPAFIAAVMLSVLEPWLRRRLPKTLHLIAVPTICLALLVPATVILFGPLGTTVAHAVSQAISWVWGLSPAIAGALMGGLWQVFVIFGVHWGFVPVMVNDLAVQGYSLLTGPLVAAVLAQGAAAFAVFLRTRNPSLRALSGAASVSAVVAGVTEPAIYGVTLRLRRPFVYACAAGAVGGAIAAAGRSAADSFVFPGLFTLPAYLSVGSFRMQLAGTGAAVVLAFALTWFLGFTDVPVTPPGETGAAPVPLGVPAAPPVPAPPVPAAPAPAAPVPAPPVVGGSPVPGPEPTATTVIRAPLSGEVVALAEVPDPVFARGLLGSGAAVRPTGTGLVRAPVAGRVRTIARAQHALGIATDDGLDVLVHIGIDTVRLGGRHFDMLVSRDQRVAAGQPIAHADLAALRADGYDATTVVVLSNAAAVGELEVVAEADVAAGAPLLTVHRRGPEAGPPAG